MSSRILESRFSRTGGRRRSGKQTTELNAPAETTGPLKERPEEEATEEEEIPRTLNIRFGFISLYGKLTVIEVSEEVWGNHRYYCAALSDDPSICIKSLDLKEAILTLVRHLVRSPTIRKYYFEKHVENPAPSQRMRVGGITIF